MVCTCLINRSSLPTYNTTLLCDAVLLQFTKANEIWRRTKLKLLSFSVIYRQNFFMCAIVYFEKKFSFSRWNTLYIFNFCFFCDSVLPKRWGTWFGILFLLANWPFVSNGAKGHSWPLDQPSFQDKTTTSEAHCILAQRKQFLSLNSPT